MKREQAKVLEEEDGPKQAAIIRKNKDLIPRVVPIDQIYSFHIEVEKTLDP